MTMALFSFVLFTLGCLCIARNNKLVPQHTGHSLGRKTQKGRYAMNKTATRLMILVAFVATALLVGSTSAYAARTEAECMLFFGPEQEDCLDSLSSVPAAAPAAPAPQETAGAPAPVAPAAAAKKPAAPKKEPKKPAPAPAPAPAPQATTACACDTTALEGRVTALEAKKDYALWSDSRFWLALIVAMALMVIVMGALFKGAMRDAIGLLEASFGLKYKKLKERLGGVERLQLKTTQNELVMQAIATQGEVDRLTDEVRALENNLAAAAAALESAGDGTAFKAAKDHQKTVVETLEKQRKLLQEAIARHEKIVAQQKEVEGRLAALDSTPDDHDDDHHGHGGHEPHGH